jgi:spermidine/putrescine transport system permease protein
MPFWSSFLVRIFAWKTLLHPDGFLKKMLLLLHFVQADTLLLYNTTAVLVVMVYSYLPFAILPIYAQAVRFNYHLIEAALDLGATEMKAFFSIFCPSIYKAIATACIMVFVPAIGAYVIPDIVGGSHCEMIGNRIAQKVFIERNLPFASALSVIMCIVITIPFFFMPTRNKR